MLESFRVGQIVGFSRQTHNSWTRNGRPCGRGICVLTLALSIGRRIRLVYTIETSVILYTIYFLYSCVLADSVRRALHAPPWFPAFPRPLHSPSLTLAYPSGERRTSENPPFVHRPFARHVIRGPELKKNKKYDLDRRHGRHGCFFSPRTEHEPCRFKPPTRRHSPFSRTTPRKKSVSRPEHNFQAKFFFLSNFRSRRKRFELKNTKLISRIFYLTLERTQLI